MARLRYNGLTATLGADLLTADTTITFTAALTSAAGNVPTITGSDYIPLAILDATGKPVEIVHLTAYTSGATTGTVTRAQESTTAADRATGSTVVHGLTVADVNGLPSASAISVTPTGTIAATDVQAALAELDTDKVAKQGWSGKIDTSGAATGGITVTSTTWVDLDNTLDLVLAVNAGDYIEVTMSGRWQNQTTYGFIDAVATASGNSITGSVAGSGSQGYTAWTGNTGVETSIGGTLLYQVQAADIAAGQITIRFKTRLYATGSKVVTLLRSMGKVLGPFA